MAGKEALEKMRQEIDSIDEQMMKLFNERMQLADNIAEIKRESNIALVNYEREERVIQNALAKVSDEIAGETVTFARSIMALSKSRQRQRLYGNAEEYYFPEPRAPLTENVKVSYRGNRGGWCETAARNFFSGAELCQASNHEEVFNAVKNKAASYGVVPIENSQTGGVGEVHDLLRRYGCYIVGQTWVPREYCLMASRGSGIQDIKVVYSHPKAFAQCEKFLKGRPWELVACNDAATAAQKVAEAEAEARARGEVSKYAAIGPARAAEVNGLSILTPEIESSATEKTRYILIGDTPEYDDECDTVSIIFRTAHRSGALVDTLFPLMSENVNMKRLESRPVADAKYCFFCDMEGHINSEAMSKALRNAAASCGYLEILGCYRDKTPTRYIM